MTTDGGVHEADVLVVALGADYDLDATPGLADGGNEFYSVAGAERLAEVLPDVLRRAGRSSASAARRSSARRRRARRRCCCTTTCRRGASATLRDLARHAVRDPGSSVARHLHGAARRLRRARHRVRPGRRVSSLDPARRVAVLDDGSELPYDLFLGVPKHRAPDVVVASGMTEDGYVPVDPRTLETRFPGRLRGRRRRHGRRAEGRRVRRRGGARRRRGR